LSLPIQPSIDFLYQLDELKSIERKNYTNQGARRENSAEHSWHLAMACWSLARALDLKVSEERLIKLALVHDLGETDAGDTFLYSNSRGDAHHAERDCVKRLGAHPGNSIEEFESLWEEQETGHSAETKLLKVVDRLLPFMLNIQCEGKTWKEYKIKRSQVESAHGFIRYELPEIYAWVDSKIKLAVEKGWLIDE